ncbi:uncharacterized protein BO88DRAFT_403097 [Aspergillus vadensis CBS 113365]|uniref:Uncharacterized protein n=1 Tax=Aspergillus vadensis (strain CBS 113365 / IMI 142717 / IBT 24658) TaxID=1448311 RepID=A0A319C0R2_ASPVC|nr:hypothetical protein BO88DRAFT_403097 [Aspergillus vadensis CBS 113365]PYH71763.1 hypothetical protein BO88DRAFT_403097 [Aspergillus vadensis CBS 113365]
MAPTPDKGIIARLCMTSPAEFRVRPWRVPWFGYPSSPYRHRPNSFTYGRVVGSDDFPRLNIGKKADNTAH